MNTWKRITAGNKAPWSERSLNHCVGYCQANTAIPVKYGTQSFC